MSGIEYIDPAVPLFPRIESSSSAFPLGSLAEALKEKDHCTLKTVTLFQCLLAAQRLESTRAGEED